VYIIQDSRAGMQTPGCSLQPGQPVFSHESCLLNYVTTVCLKEVNAKMKTKLPALCLAIAVTIFAANTVEAGRFLFGHRSCRGCSGCERTECGCCDPCRSGHWRSGYSGYGVATACCGGLSSVSGTVASGHHGRFLSGYEGLPNMSGCGVHYRYPYHSYRRPWAHPGPASTNVTIVW
jgi:hypothetical protein